MLTYSEEPAKEPLKLKAIAAEELKKQERMRDVTPAVAADCRARRSGTEANYR